jgi:hypothetical protein
VETPVRLLATEATIPKRCGRIIRHPQSMQTIFTLCPKGKSRDTIGWRLPVSRRGDACAFQPDLTGNKGDRASS